MHSCRRAIIDDGVMPAELPAELPALGWGPGSKACHCAAHRLQPQAAGDNTPGWCTERRAQWSETHENLDARAQTGRRNI
jgi:hypothetical protein